MAFIFYVTQIQIDFGAIGLLKAECERVGIRRPLIVTDPGVQGGGRPAEGARRPARPAGGRV